jgi:hypothetical protein
MLCRYSTIELDESAFLNVVINTGSGEDREEAVLRILSWIQSSNEYEKILEQMGHDYIEANCMIYPSKKKLQNIGEAMIYGKGIKIYLENESKDHGSRDSTVLELFKFAVNHLESTGAFIGSKTPFKSLDDGRRLDGTEWNKGILWRKEVLPSLDSNFKKSKDRKITRTWKKKDWYRKPIWERVEEEILDVWEQITE